MTPERRKLLGLIRSYSLEVSAPGTYFESPGGGRTTEYFNIKRACMSGHLHEPLGLHLYQELLAFAPVDATAGIVLGGCHLASVLSFYSGMLDILYVRKVSKEHGRTPGFIEGYITKGMRVVLLDDVVSAGKSAMTAAGHLRDAGLDVRGMITVIDRRRERPEALLDGTKVRALFTIDELIYDGMDMKTGRPL
jgi:orotate phosphoribosyltransferase